jgi:mono/diheme cytochrome c family protein
MTRRLGPWLAGVALVLSALSPLAAQDKPTIKKVPAQAITSLEGKDNFQEYCAVCHGKDAQGKGPAAPALKTPPADLTTIAKRRQGKFPSLEVREIIEGNRQLSAHGDREMPMWGSVFRSIGAGMGDQTPVMRVQNLVKYVESLQVK